MSAPDPLLQASIDATFTIDTDVNMRTPSFPAFLIPGSILSLLGDENSIPDVSALSLSDGSSITSTNAFSSLALPLLQPTIPPTTHPLTHYFISTSHNTYLMGRQLVGKSTAEAYRHILGRGGRCVEVDVWPGKGDAEPVVTHGYTLSKSIPFRDVCRAIGDVLAFEDGQYDSGNGAKGWPVLISVECHVGVDGQEGMVSIMREELGQRLVEGMVEGVDDERVTPGDLMGKVVCMIEFYPPPSDDDSSSSSSDTDSEGSEDAPPRPTKISPGLAALGYYARSLKPASIPAWDVCPSIFTPPTFPRHILINISESTIFSSVFASKQAALVQHARHHLRRVFPKGTRIGSGNMDVVRAWRGGSQVVGVNWQKWDRGMMLGEALFVGTGGWVLRPGLEEEGDAKVKKQVKMTLRIAGVSGIAKAEEGERLYVRATLIHKDGDKKLKTKSVKPVAYAVGECTNVAADKYSRDQSLDRVAVERVVSSADSRTGDDVTVLATTFPSIQVLPFDALEDDPLAFLNIQLMEDEFGLDDVVAGCMVKVSDLQQGWRVWRLLSYKGDEGKWRGYGVVASWSVEES